ncbi:MAG: radical SAM family heme chaperone HemW [Planctomycetota bacterium]
MPAPRSLYIHVPFCLHRCAYCNFYSEILRPGKAGPLVGAILMELDRVPREFRPGTVYIGGGTPTALPGELLAQLLAAIPERFDMTDLAEWTVEATPATLSAETAGILRRAGVGRLAMGVESFDDKFLKSLGRPEKADQIPRAIAVAREAGFANLGLDLIFAIPGQSPDDWRRDLERAIAFAPEHLSIYGLTYEEGTALSRRAADGKTLPVEEEVEVALFRTAADTLEAAGYEHYEISNYARSGFRCRHNEIYWRNESHYALGPSAVSFTDGERRRNIADTTEYVARISRGEDPTDFRERLSPEKFARETLALLMRTAAGVDLAAFRARFGLDAETLFGAALGDYLARGILARSPDNAIISPGRLALTRDGRLHADTVAVEVV